MTEELLPRGGLMSFLAGRLWRFAHRGAGDLNTFLLVVASAPSPVFCGVGPLPAAAALTGELGWPVVAYVVAGNAAFGIVAGYLFWRHGLEAAIIAHTMTHVFAGMAVY